MKPILKTIWTDRKAVSEKRLAICRQCEHFRERGARCEKCGCFMEYKTMMMSAICPVGKWDKESENTGDSND